MYLMHLAYITFIDSNVGASTEKTKLVKNILVMAGVLICMSSV